MAIGGAAAVVTLWLLLWPLGLAAIVVGLVLWLYSLDRFPIKIIRKQKDEAPNDRRELLGLAQAVRIELETCRYRLSKARNDRRGWFADRQLPAQTHNTRWTPALVTADEISVNDALRGFYVWADEINASMSDRASVEVNYIGSVIPGNRKTLDLDDDDLAELVGLAG